MCFKHASIARFLAFCVTQYFSRVTATICDETEISDEG